MGKPAADGLDDFVRGACQMILLVQSTLSAMLRKAAPTTYAFIVPILATLGEFYFLGFLGTDTIAAVSLVFPVATLVQMISAGDIGGAVSGAIAREWGAGRREEANALVLHALVLALIFGGLCIALQLCFAHRLYAMLGGTGPILEMTVVYSNVIFFGSPFLWIANQLAAAIRGCGDVSTPAKIMIAARVVTFPLYPILILGFGPIPKWGVSGAAVVDLLFYALSSVGYVSYLLKSKEIQLKFDCSRLKIGHFMSIIRVGGVLTIRTLQSAATLVVLVGSVGTIGPNAIAGYGIASRLDSIFIPLLFGFGTSILLTVANDIGAQSERRAYFSAAIGVVFVALLAEAVGISVSIWPSIWIRWFSQDPAVIAQGEIYLSTVGPFYGFFCGGFMVYFVAQATKYLRWNFAAAFGRLAVVGFGCYLAALHNPGLASISWIVGISYLIFGLLNGLTIAPRLGWFPFVKT
jgi:putative MATE family efflux protein